MNNVNDDEFTLNFSSPQIKIVPWDEEQDNLRSIRTTVFIEEQSVPKALEWDGLDEAKDSLHFLVLLDGDAIACARITRKEHQGKIGRMAVLEPYRQQGIGSALLRFMLLKMPSLNFPSAIVNAQCKALGFYQKFNFKEKGGVFDEAGILHQKMYLTLAPNRSHVISDDLIPLYTQNDFQQKALELAKNTRQKLSIFSLNLDPNIYNNQDFVDAVLAITKNNRYSEVRLLIKDSNALIKKSHKLVLFSQRSPNQITIKRISVNPKEFTSAYLISDDGGIIYQNEEDLYRGVCYFSNRGRVRTQLEEFNLLWNSAVTDPELQRLTF